MARTFARGRAAVQEARRRPRGLHAADAHPDVSAPPPPGHSRPRGGRRQGGGGGTVSSSVRVSAVFTFGAICPPVTITSVPV